MVITPEVDTLFNNTIIEIIEKLNKQKKRADVNSIHAKVIKVKKFEDIAKSDLDEKITMLIVEKIVKNKFTRNRDSFHINKDKVYSLENQSLPTPFESQNTSISIHKNLDKTKSHKYSLSPLMNVNTPVQSNKTQNISLNTSILYQENSHEKSPDFNVIVRTPEVSQRSKEIPTIDLTKNDIKESETLIDEMFEKTKFLNLKNELINEINQNLEMRFKNELLAFKGKCEKFVQQSYLNSKIYIQKLEEEINHKDKIINDLLICLQNIPTMSPKNIAVTSLPITKQDNTMPDETLNKLKKISSLVTTINHGSNEKLENQLKTVRNLQKEQYYSQHFNRVKDSSILIEDSSNNNLDQNKKNEVDVHTESPEMSVKTKKIKKKTVLIIGDSMVNGIEESKLSKSRHIRVQPLSGAKIEDLQANINELLHKDLEKIVLHAGTNNSTNDTPEDIFEKLKTLVGTIQSSLPECNVIVSNIIKRTDNQKANAVCEKVNRLLKSSSLCVLDNNNIKEKYLGKRGLHLKEYKETQFLLATY